MTIIFATNNLHKIAEVVKVLPPSISILTLKDINCLEELPETHPTITENAIEKAMYVANKYKVNCFADDSGLCIEALNGEPGVNSAMYAGTRNSEDNIVKVLNKLADVTNRNAYFTTVIALVINSVCHVFEGKIHGKITTDCKGNNGFGYDPIFIPNGYNKTFAEMSNEEKNNISHRAIASKKMAEFLS